LERRALAVAVRELRARERMSQESVSVDAGLGRGFVSELETGRRRVSFEALVSIADVLGLTMQEVGEAFDRARDRARRRAGSRPPT
jgi:transcriptional regulator with XRE-family HTH domain